MKKTFVTLSFLALGLYAVAQGGISEEMLDRMKSQNKMTAADKALRNALAVNDIRALALNQDNMAEKNTYFSNSVPSKGITDQKSSGRCWLFTGLNVMRSRMILDQGLEGMEFSQNYLFFFDQLEKSNLFLQAVIDTRKKPMDDKTVEWLLKPAE